MAFVRCTKDQQYSRMDAPARNSRRTAPSLEDKNCSLEPYMALEFQGRGKKRQHRLLFLEELLGKSFSAPSLTVTRIVDLTI
jgi:hypothetical protein